LKKGFVVTNTPEMPLEDVQRIELEMMRQEHRDLDAAIAALGETVHSDTLTLKRLKRNKLSLKDKIARLEDAITPDIIA
jgi:hypothetical protein